MTTQAPSFSIGSLFLQVMNLEWVRNSARSELAALERMDIMREMLLPLACLLFLDGSSFLQVTRSTLKAWMSLNFGKILSLTSE